MSGHFNQLFWKEVRLAECLRGEPQYGANASALDFDPSLPRYIRISDIDDCGRLRKEGGKSIPKEAGQRYILKKGDFLLARSGATAGKAYLHRESRGDYAYAGYLIRFPLNKEIMLPEFLAHFTQSLKYRLWVKQQIRGGAQPNINAQQYLGLPIPCPPIIIQEKITTILNWWDKLWEKTEKLIESKEQRLMVYNLRLIHNPKHQGLNLGEVTTEITRRNNGHPICRRLLSVTNQRGFVLSEKQFQHIPVCQNLANYKIIRSGEYAYNPSRLTVGSIARLDEFEEGVLSPMYVVFKLDKEKIISDFFLYWLSSIRVRQAIIRRAQGSVREIVNFDDLKTLPIPCPTQDKQEKICSLLGAMKQEIVLLKAQLKMISLYKAGLWQRWVRGSRLKVQD